MIDKTKLKNFLLDINFKAEKLTDSQHQECLNRGMLDALDEIFREIESGRLNINRSDITDLDRKIVP